MIKDKYNFSLSFGENKDRYEILLQGKDFDISALTKPIDFGLPDGVLSSEKRVNRLLTGLIGWVKTCQSSWMLTLCT